MFPGFSAILMIFGYPVLDVLQLALTLLKYFVDLKQTEFLDCKLITKIIFYSYILSIDINYKCLPNIKFSRI